VGGFEGVMGLGRSSEVGGVEDTVEAESEEVVVVLMVDTVTEELDGACEGLFNPLGLPPVQTVFDGASLVSTVLTTVSVSEAVGHAE